MATIQYKQSAPEVIKAVSEVEAALASKGKAIHIISKPGMTPSQLELASANRAAIEVYLFQNFRADGLINATFDSLWRTVVALYKGGSIKSEANAATDYKPVLTSTTGRINHAHKQEMNADSPLKRQRQAQLTAEDHAKTREIWCAANDEIQMYRHGGGRNHARNQHGQKILRELFEKRYAAGQHSRVQALAALQEIKTRARQLEDEVR